MERKKTLSIATQTVVVFMPIYDASYSISRSLLMTVNDDKIKYAP